MKTKQVRISEELHWRAKAAAVSQKKTLAEWVEDLIAVALLKMNPKPRK